MSAVCALSLFQVLTNLLGESRIQSAYSGIPMSGYLRAFLIRTNEAARNDAKVQRIQSENKDFVCDVLS